MCLGKIEINYLLSVVLLLRAHDDSGPSLGIFDCEIVLNISILDTIGLFWIEHRRHAWYDVERRKVMYVHGCGGSAATRRQREDTIPFRRIIPAISSVGTARLYVCKWKATARVGR